VDRACKRGAGLGDRHLPPGGRPRHSPRRGNRCRPRHRGRHARGQRGRLALQPPAGVKQRSVKGNRLRWLRAGKRDGLFRYEIAIDVVDKGKETAYLFRVGRAFQLELVRSVRGHNLSPRTFAQ
jgi:hypothetical protein